MNCFKQCFYIMFMMNLFLGIGPGYFIGLISYYMSNDSNIERWDYSFKATKTHVNEHRTSNFGASFYLNQKENDKLDKMKADEPDLFNQFNQNMENMIYKETKRECSEAQYEQKRLKQRARYFNHRPEKAQEILKEAQSLQQLWFCDELEKYNEILNVRKE